MQRRPRLVDGLGHELPCSVGRTPALRPCRPDGGGPHLRVFDEVHPARVPRLLLRARRALAAPRLVVRVLVGVGRTDKAAQPRDVARKGGVAYSTASSSVERGPQLSRGDGPDLPVRKKRRPIAQIACSTQPMSLRGTVRPESGP